MSIKTSVANLCERLFGSSSKHFYLLLEMAQVHAMLAAHHVQHEVLRQSLNERRDRIERATKALQNLTCDPDGNFCADNEWSDGDLKELEGVLRILTGDDRPSFKIEINSAGFEAQCAKVSEMIIKLKQEKP